MGDEGGGLPVDGDRLRRDLDVGVSETRAVPPASRDLILAPAAIDPQIAATPGVTQVGQNPLRRSSTGLDLLPGFAGLAFMRLRTRTAAHAGGWGGMADMPAPVHPSG
jgi:hypothetical protein